ncbi:MAG TPA: tetratricopeptide repeat protein [Burkholderiales bacterium]
MSLLLEALKKAEKAKEEAQRRARGDAGEPETPAPAAPAAERKTVLTRDKLPDIATTPLEIVSDDIATPAAPERQAAELSIEPPPSSRPAARPAAAARPKEPPRGADEEANRASAKKVFEAKFREPNPRMPFYITMGVLGVFAVGTVIYFWYQLRPPPPLVSLEPAHQAQAAGAAPTPPPAAAAAASSLPTAANAIPGLPSMTARETAPAPQAPAAAPTAQKAIAQAQPETPRLAPRLAPRPSAPAPSSEAAANVPRAAAQVQPNVAAGYEAYLAGDLTAARTQYEQALRDEPNNRDAMLGLAAVDVRTGRYESAEAFYLRVLQIEPRDAQAQAALIALRSGRSDPLATESRVKSLLASEPGAHALNFTLGNQLAQQNRWAEAQQEYFKAYVAEPDNADFAYNLAVSLDHLRQPRQALQYYQRAIALAEKRGAGFDLQAARMRVDQLSK